MEFEQVELTMMVSVLMVCGIGLGIDKLRKTIKRLNSQSEFDPRDLGILPPAQRGCERECFRDDIR